MTVAVAGAPSDPDLAARKNALYAAAHRPRHGGDAILLDATSTTGERAAAFAAMDGLLLSGGADLDPARYGQPQPGSTAIEPDRDALEHAAWAAASDAAVPVLGICRGFQAINVFSGGTLLQHVDGHAGSGLGHRAAATSIRSASRPARGWPGSCSRPTPAAASCASTRTTTRASAADLAPGLVANAWASSPAGDLVEASRRPTGGSSSASSAIPSGPESTPPAFERLFAVFVDAAPTA